MDEVFAIGETSQTFLGGESSYPFLRADAEFCARTACVSLCVLVGKSFVGLMRPGQEENNRII